MINYMSDLTRKTKRELRAMGAIIEENSHERGLVRLWFDDNLMTLTHNGDLWYLAYKGETTLSPEEEIPLAVRFLLNFTVKYRVFDYDDNKQH